MDLGVLGVKYEFVISLSDSRGPPLYNYDLFIMSVTSKTVARLTRLGPGVAAMFSRQSGRVMCPDVSLVAVVVLLVQDPLQAVAPVTPVLRAVVVDGVGVVAVVRVVNVVVSVVGAPRVCMATNKRQKN